MMGMLIGDVAGIHNRHHNISGLQLDMAEVLRV